ncbi:DUF2637 domain-containing protein [Kineococcus indalonis]|uniref:DUF2637 domain-containing protein n=1 Tax=Kineococcus indalonis TaxID=2696566 RepID=UPI0014135F5E|nr:DUF2637 domain-containing protein [Kineococcus indalonis]NAZ85232.1 DUF2637 domain-containing protein [Kineococcus indalonis]
MSAVSDAAVSDRWLAERSAEEGAGRFDVLAERAAAIGVGVLIVTGFAASYTTLRDLAAGVGGFPPWLAPVVPLSFDVGIVVLSLKVVLAARAGRSARLLRALVVALSVATVLVNGAAAQGLTGWLLHAVPPAMFVVCFETLAAGARHAALHARGSEQQEQRPSLPAARWLLAPRQTWRLWREHVLTISSPLAQSSELVVSGDRVPADQSEEVLGSRGVPVLPAAKTALPVQLGEPEAGTGPPGGELCEPAPGPLSASTAAPTPAAGSSPTRFEVAVEAVSREPGITAVALAEVLRAAGHGVSMRTAQRVRADAGRHLTAAGGTGELS